jgi:hypothetical protein
MGAFRRLRVARVDCDVVPKMLSGTLNGGRVGMIEGAKQSNQSLCLLRRSQAVRSTRTGPTRGLQVCNDEEDPNSCRTRIIALVVHTLSYILRTHLPWREHLARIFGLLPPPCTDWMTKMTPFRVESCRVFGPRLPCEISKIFVIHGFTYNSS